MDDNPKAFKHWFSPTVVADLGARLASLDPTFDRRAYARVTAPLTTLELKARVALVAEALHAAIPHPFPEAAQLLCRALPGPTDPPRPDTSQPETSQIVAWSLCHFVGRYGLTHHAASMRALHTLTQRFSAEFDIRHFLLSDPERTLKTLRKWARDPSEHVRRLVSEGTRTRLPWGVRLQPFIDDPTPILPLLDALHDDPSEYVRRSVANNLNDLAKDHPDLVIERVRAWHVDTPAHRALAQRALRTLIKQGHAEALAVMGVQNGARVDTAHFDLTERVRIGGTLVLEARLANPGSSDLKVVVDFALHYLGPDGRPRAPKVFKWKTFVLPAGAEATLAKRHPMREVSIRRLNTGAHRVDLQVNGARVASRTFVLE